MKSFLFEVDFGYGPKLSNSAVFNLELSEREIVFIRKYLQENGKDCGYADIESEDRRLFDKINDASNEAVIKEINKHSEKKFGFWDIDWPGMTFDFIWPNELME